MPVGSNWSIDDHPTVATGREEHKGLHTQVLPEEAAVRGWYYRRAPYLSLEPDTRRCRCHGKIMYPALPLTTEERSIRSPMSTNVLRGEPIDSYPQPGVGTKW